MPRLHLTERAIAKMAAPDPSGRQALYWDTELKGFAVLCSGTTNARSYIVQRDMGGRTKRLTVAAVAELPLAKARLRAAEMLLDLRNGINPVVKADANATLRMVLKDYLAARKDLRPASVRAYKQIERVLASWLDMPLRNLTPDMVEMKHREIASKIGKSANIYSGTTMANVAMKTLGILWNFAADRIADLPPNPVRRLRRQWYPTPRRTRIVRNDELASFYAAVRALPNKIVADYLTLILFTGMRRGEASSLTWDDIDLAGRTIHVPAERTKAKRALTLPMSDVVYDLLVARRALGRDKYIFPSTGEKGHITNSQLALSMVAKATGITISAHDLRRTYCTTAESVDVSTAALKALVNHANGGDVTTGYIIFNVERLREPVQRIADRLKELCKIEEPAGANVKKLARK